MSEGLFYFMRCYICIYHAEETMNTYDNVRIVVAILASCFAFMFFGELIVRPIALWWDKRKKSKEAATD